MSTVDSRYRHTRYRPSRVQRTHHRCIDFFPAKSCSFWTLTDHDIRTQIFFSELRLKRYDIKVFDDVLDSYGVWFLARNSSSVSSLATMGA